ncbi:hypothetical protein S7711_04069 [Stachybotrys chartarum IBT 7711]|uniref:Peptidase M14 domain-containing protein n=1 Tax=Stachybotrys chartarum (strain CBS 109288 / IBT 7711) TaxID=1280523 RepID=A0A084AR20_STACB|nr:hypothetical protein S7711_04069 [Stachybotrys chartarum IBT 7711]
MADPPSLSTFPVAHSLNPSLQGKGRGMTPWTNVALITTTRRLSEASIAGYYRRSGIVQVKMRFQSIISVGLFQASLVKAQLAYADNQDVLSQDGPLVAANFPDVEGIELHSPAFTNPETVPEGFANATSGPTDLLTLDNFLRTLAARNEWLTYHNPSFRSEEGRSLPYVYLSTSNAPSGPSPVLSSFANTTRPSNKVRIWLQGGVHGNEPAGDQALLALLGHFDANATWAASILEHADLLVLPRYNPDGVAYFQRYLATSFDPNRDHTKLARQQTRDIKSLVMNFAPHVGVDCHEYTATRGYGANGQWFNAQDGQFSAMKNLLIHRDIRRLSETLFQDSMAAAMENLGLRWGPYVTGSLETDDIVLDETSSDAKIGDTSVALSQAVMFLTETRGIRLGDQHWQRRVATGFTLVKTLVETAAYNAREVYDTIEAARADFISNDDDIVVTDYPTATNITWQYINSANGSLVDVPVTFNNWTQNNANLTRARPEAYVFSRAWHDVADRLRAAGVVVDELYADFRGEVEALNITSAALAASKYEGIARTTVTTEALQRHVTIPAGGFWVSTRQKNAAHAFSVLEPENIDSYATFNVLPVNTGDLYQVYRVLRS